MKNVRTLTFFEKSAYGLGQLAEGLKNGSFGAFLFFYYVQVLGLSGAYAGLAIGIALLIDAITDPLAGSISDNSQSKIGRRHPFIYAAAVPLAFSFYMLFSPACDSQIGLFVWLLVFAILTRVSMTFYYVPHIALGAELSSDFDERTTIVAFRQLFSSLGVLLAYAIGFGIFFRPTAELTHGQFNAAAYSPFALLTGLLMIVSILASAGLTQKHVTRFPVQVFQSTANSRSPLSSVKRMLSEAALALTNRSFAWLMSGVLIITMIVGVDAALHLHMNTYFWELSSNQNFVVFIVYPVGIVSGTSFAYLFARYLDKKLVIVLGTVWWSSCQLIPVTMRILGAFPENGSPALFASLATIKFLQGFGVVQAVIVFNSMIADLVDEHELKSGGRQEGIFFAAVSFSGKIATGFGILISGLVLDLIDWPRGGGVLSPDYIDPDTLFSLGLLYGPILAGFAVVGVWCYSKYNLDRARHSQILAELNARNSMRRTPPGTNATFPRRPNKFS